MREDIVLHCEDSEGYDFCFLPKHAFVAYMTHFGLKYKKAPVAQLDRAKDF